jgi:aminoglycoside phosphotransferase family enzyme/predicted kinase/phosphoglycolate phosphatase-like HAD superfamily hydrolase
VLWDIDGTLVKSGGVAARAFLDAVAEVTGSRPSNERRDYGGRLDTEIADMLLRAVNADLALVPDVLKVLERLTGERLADLRAQTSAYPGIEALLATLANAGVRQTVVTGNIAAIARHKLDAGGLVPPIDLGFGGFGDSAPDRAAVARFALDRLAEAGWEPDPQQVWIVGDTPRDLACARAVGIRCALVATGRRGIDELNGLGADIVLPDLSDPRPLLDLWGLTRLPSVADLTHGTRGRTSMSEPATTAASWQGEPWAAMAETHSAVVFFAGDRAWKLKKPVNLGFLDFSTPRARAEACRRETELNRRFSPGEYLGVAEIHDPDGQIGDYLVAMRRMPSSRRLSAIVRDQEPADAPLRQIARLLAAAHARAQRGPEISAEGSRDALRQRWADNIEQARELAEPPRGQLGPPVIDEIERLASRFLAGREPLLSRRMDENRIIDGHGDLLADDIFCLDDGPRIIDCLDFDDRLRWVDGLDDAAFLAMDLERLGAPGLARRFLSDYAEFSADSAPASLRHHYIAYRAFVRAKVALLRADESAGPDADRLADLTVRHLRAGAVTLVLTGGLPASGKSTLAGGIADRLGFTVLSSDRIRKELAGLAAESDANAPYKTGIYTPEWTERTYAELLRRATALMTQGESVVADASFTSAWQRDAAAMAAAGVSADLVQVQCAVARDVAEARMRTRAPSGSDADAEIAARMATAADPWPEAALIDTGKGGSTAGSTAGSTVEGSDAAREESLRQALAAVRPGGPGGPGGV